MRNGPRLDTLWAIVEASRRMELAWAEQVAEWALSAADGGHGGAADEFGLARYRVARQRTALARTMLNLEQYGTFDSPYDRPAAAVSP